MEHFFLALHMDLSDTAPSGPGWYLQATSDTAGKLLEPTSIPSDAAQELSNAFQTALQSTEGEIPSVSISQLVKSATVLIHDALARQLKLAEEWAAKVGPLRRKLGQLPPKKES